MLFFFRDSMLSSSLSFFVCFFNDTAITEIYTLSLHDALPICSIELHLLYVPIRNTVKPLRVLRAKFVPSHRLSVPTFDEALFFLQTLPQHGSRGSVKMDQIGRAHV